MAETVLFQEVDPQALFGGEFPNLGLGVIAYDDKAEASNSGRLAARHAVTQVLPVTYLPEDITILNRESGRPYVEFEETLYTRLLEQGIVDIPVSITHDASVAMGLAAEDRSQLDGLRIGLDMTTLERMRMHIQAGIKKSMTPDEIREIGDDHHSLARRFSAKEALSKVLGTGLKNGTYLRTMVTHEEDGLMSVQLTEGALGHQQRLGLTHFHIRTVESQGAVAAFVLAHR